MKIKIFVIFCISLIISGCSSKIENNEENNNGNEKVKTDYSDKPISEMTMEEIEQLPEFRAKMRELAPIFAKQKVEFKMLCSRWERCKTNQEKLNFIDRNEYKVGEMFDVDISTISKAQNLFVTHADDFLKVLETRLKGQACLELAEEKYKKAYELRYSE